MIATILQSTSNFHAVAYNEKKVAEGSAVLLEMKNFGAIGIIGYSGASQLQDYLIQYSAMNERIKKPQFHLAISCKGHEWSPEQLLDFAHDYLDEMGYGDPEQPLLVYSHHDTDNTHIHIITSRVNPQGKKINDSKERIRSQKTIEKLLGKDMRAKADADVKAALGFDFLDMRQFKSVLEAMKYECFETGDKYKGYLCVKKSGVVLVKIPKETIRKQCEKNSQNRESDVAERMKWKSIFIKYRNQNSDVRGLEKGLRSSFGLSLVWLGSKDKPWGYQVVDFHKKKVYHGNKILHIEQLCKFMTKEEQAKQINQLIDETLNDNPYITTKELNAKIKKFGGYVKKDSFICNDIRTPLDKGVVDTLNRNNKIHWLQSFHPSSNEEKMVLCKLMNFDNPDMIKIELQEPESYKKNEVKDLYMILVKKQGEEKRKAFEDAGYRLYQSSDGKLFVFNLEKNVILEMSKTGLPQGICTDLNKASNTNPNSERKGGAIIPQKGGRILDRNYSSSSQNREWEVGKKKRDDDDPDKKESITY